MSQDTPGADAEGVAPSLDKRTQLPGDGPVSVSIYPDCGEAVIVEAGQSGAESEESEWSKLPDDERARRNHLRKNRRARTKMERYIVGNRLRYMWVLTLKGDGLHGDSGRKQIMKLVASFADRFRQHYGAQPYCCSPEIHPGGHGWHVNFFIGKRIDKYDFEALWGHGGVWVSDFVEDSRVKALRLSFVEALRMAATYGSKYASKDWDSQVLEEGAHRYEVAQGFEPKQVSYRTRTFQEGCRIAIRTFGQEPTSVWCSSDCEDWDGPPVMKLKFAAAATPFGTRE